MLLFPQASVQNVLHCLLPVHNIPNNLLSCWLLLHEMKREHSLSIPSVLVVHAVKCSLRLRPDSNIPYASCSTDSAVYM